MRYRVLLYLCATYILFTVACAHGTDEAALAELATARQVALAFVKADYERDWKAAYSHLWTNAQKLWDEGNYAKYLEAAYQKVSISDPKVVYSSLYADEPGYATVWIKGAAQDSKVIVIIMIKEETWRILFAEPLVSGYLSRKALFQLISDSEPPMRK